MKRHLNTIITLLLALLMLTGCRTHVVPGPSADPSHKPGADISSVVINEVVSANSLSYIDQKYGSLDWIEIKNVSAQDADISGWRLSDSPSASKAIVFPDGTVIPSGGFLIVLCKIDLASGADEDGVFIAPFGISRSGEKLYLTAADGKTSVMDVPYLTTDVSFARRADGTYGFSATPTCGEDNVNVASSLEEAMSTVILPEDDLRISELVIGSQGWVELKNISGAEINLSLYMLSDSESDPMKWTFPEMTLAPGAFIVVELNADNPEALSASFKVSRTEGVIYLFNSMRQLVDSMAADPAMPEGVSAVRFGRDDVQYTSHVTKGAQNSTDTFPAVEWTAMDLVNDPSVRVCLNEVCPKNKYGIVDSYGDRSDWVELYNISGMPADLSEYYLSDDVTDPLKWRLPEVSLLPGEYLVIFLSGNETIGSEIHAPFGLSSTDRGIWLSCLSGMKQDYLPIPEDLAANASVGRNDAFEICYYAAPTPGAANTTFGFDKYASILSFDPNGLYFSEVSAVSAPGSSSSDWVEIVNCSASAKSLAGYSITDDPAEPRKFTFGSTLIEAGGFAVVYCDSSVAGSSSVAPFSVSNCGETLYLIDPDGAVIDVFETGMTTVGVTSGRADRSQTGSRCFFTAPTMGSKNGVPVDGYVHEPVFSRDQLSYSSAVTVEISCATEGAEIRYTLDGSTPTKDSRLYTGPLTISSNSVVKARAFMTGLISSPTAVHTYLINENFTLPVVSLSMSPYDYSRMYRAEMGSNGGVTHGDQVGCFMEYYVDGKLAVSSGAGVRVSGASTSVYAQKSLGLYFRAGYGRSSLDFPLFEGCSVTSFRSIVLRNSGQDAGYARIRDSYLSKICQGMNLDVSYFQPVIVFINGDYRGVYDMKENMNEDYLVGHYGVERNTVEVIKRNGRIMAGSDAQWNAMRRMCQTLDFSNQQNYDMLTEVVDADSVMDYLIARTYFYDQDMYNQKYWHTNDNTIKWRAIFYDSDYAMFGNSPSTNILTAYFNRNGVSSAHGFITNMDIFCALNQNPGWREKFITRYIYYVKYVFNSENALRVYDELVAVYKPEMVRHTARWGMMSYSKWTQEVALLRNCIAQRPAYALRNLRLYYGLSEAAFAEYERAAAELASGQN